MAEYDNLIGYTSLNSAQNLFSMNDQINGIDIKLKSLDKIDSLASGYPKRTFDILITLEQYLKFIEIFLPGLIFKKNRYQ